MNASPVQSSKHQRSQGAARVGLVAGSRGAVLSGLHQSGSAKAIVLANGPEPGPEIVFLNTSGGLTGGDRLSYALDLGPGCRASATTQTAERAYRASEGTARVDVCHSVGAGGHLDWLPQETILFDGSALARRTTIDLAPGAGCLFLESVVLGRAAMGETLRRVVFDDHRAILRAGQPVLIEPLRLCCAALDAGPAVLGGARAIASLALVTQGAEDAVDATRAVLGEAGVQGGASGFDGKLVVRLMATDGWPLRRQIARLLSVLRPGPLPRVWQA